MADKIVYLDVIEEPPYYSLFFRVKNVQRLPLAGARCELYPEANITPLTQMITSVLTDLTGLGRIPTLEAGVYGWRVIFPSGQIKTGSVTIDEAHAV